jgi:hypothetical protein
LASYGSRLRRQASPISFSTCCCRFCVWQMLGAAFNQCGTRSQSQERGSATRPTRSRFCLRLHRLRHATCSQIRSFSSAPASSTKVSSLCSGVSLWLEALIRSEIGLLSFRKKFAGSCSFSSFISFPSGRLTIGLLGAARKSAFERFESPGQRPSPHRIARHPRLPHLGAKNMRYCSKFATLSAGFQSIRGLLP